MKRLPRAAPTLMVLLCGGVLAWHAGEYYPFISDDALISLRYADRLIDGHGLTWTEGPRVEGYSNLLWVLLVAVLGWVGVDLVDAARLLGLAGGVVVLWALTATYWRPGRLAWCPAAVGLALVALSAPVAVWTIGGLEQPLVAALVALSVPLMYAALARPPEGHPWIPSLGGLSLILGLLALTRPDGALFTAAAVMTLLVSAPGALSNRCAAAARLAAWPVILYGCQAIFRFFYYDAWVPNTALVKLVSNAVRRADGMAYLWSGVEALAPFSFVAIAGMCGMLVVPESRPRMVYLLAMSALWSLYIVMVGGDIFPAFRHLVPLVVIFAFALAEMAQRAWPAIAKRAWVTVTVVIVVTLQFGAFARAQFTHKQSKRAVTERWEWDCQRLAHVLKTAFSAHAPLVAVTAAGCLPYWSELPSVDMLGLNDHYLPRHPPQGFGTGFLGHELGDGAYVLRRRPDIIVFSVGTEPSFRSGVELNAMPEFHARYVPVTTRVEGNDPNPTIYFDRYSEKIGISRTASGLSIPGFLFRSDTSAAFLNHSGTLVAALTQESPLQLELGPQMQPPWHAVVTGSHPDVTVEIASHRGGSIITLKTRQSQPVEIESVALVRPGTPGQRPAAAR